MVRILAFADWRVQPLDTLYSAVRNRPVDFMLYAGDDVNRLGSLTQDKIESEKQIFMDAFKMPYGRNFSSHRDIFSGNDWTRTEFKKRVRNRIASDKMNEGVFLFEKERGRGICAWFHLDDSSHHFAALAKQVTYGIGAILGNDCEPFDRFRIRGEHVHDLHRNPWVIEDLGIMGLEGAPENKPPGIILYDESNAEKHLQSQWELLESHDVKRRILVTHAPPEGILDYSIRWSWDHIGSKAVRTFIQEHDVDIVICGHSHLNGGNYVEVDGTLVVNAASHDERNAPGVLVWIDLKDGKPKVHECLELRGPIEWDTLFKLPQVGERRARTFVGLGITKLEDFTEDKRPLLVGLPGSSNYYADIWIGTARLLLDGTPPYRLDHDDWTKLSDERLLIYDIETDMKGEHPWCIGAWDSESENFNQFFNVDDERQLLEEYFDFIEANVIDHAVSFSKTHYDKRGLMKCADKYGLKVPQVIDDEIDLGVLVGYYTIGLPCGDLKCLANHFGFHWSDESLDGMSAGMAFSKYQRGQYESDWDSWKQYNRDDVMATVHVLRKLLDMRIS